MSDPETFLNDLQHHVDDVHTGLDRAGFPPAGLWNSVRLKATSESSKKETHIMNSVATYAPGPIASTDMMPPSREGFRHYVSLASTFALVLTVALGGWFASMHLNQSGGSNGPFALIGQTDGDGTCDVNPMTVDEVMEIAENPYRYLDENDYPTPWGSTNPPTPWQDDYQEVHPNLPTSVAIGYGNEPTQAAFDQASAVISHYLTCIQTDGSVAMMLRFTDPFSIQHHIRTEFPFYRSEEQVREYVTEWLQSGETYHSITIERLGELLTYRPAEHKAMASTQIHDFGLGFDQVIYIGSEIYDEDGNLRGNFHPTLYRTFNVDEEYLDFGVVFTLLHSRYSGDWYIVTDDWLQKADPF